MKRGWLSAAVLLTICGTAIYFRVLGLDWDEGHHLHPDERFMSMVESAIEPAGSAREYLDTIHSPLNPANRGHKFFPYGHFPLITVQYVAAWLGRPDVDLDSRVFDRELGRQFDSAYLVGRAISASCDVVTLLILFLIARSLYGSSVGLLAAALYAAAVLPIQQAHFFTVDAWTTLFVVIAFWFATRIARAERWSDDVLFGVSFGLALASKINVLPIVSVLLVAVAQRVFVSGAAAQPTAPHDRRARTVRAALSLNVAALATVLAFRLGQPYAFLPPRSDTAASGYGSGPGYALALLEDIVAPSLNPAWLAQMREVAGIVSAENDTPPGYQWAQRAPLLFPWLNMVRFGLGWPLGLAAWAGWAAALWQLLRGRRGSEAHLLPVAWIAIFFTWQGISWVKSMRYFLPLYPFLALTAAWGLSHLGRYLAARSAAHGSSRRFVVAALPTVIVLLATYAWAFAFTRIYTRPVTRVAASEWILANVPADVTLEFEAPTGICRQFVGVASNWPPPQSPASSLTPPPVTLLDDKPVVTPFVAACSGVLRRLEFHNLRAVAAPQPPARLTAIVSRDNGPSLAVANADLRLRFDDPVQPTGYGLDVVAPLEDGQAYRLLLVAPGSQLALSGSALAVDGHWEDWLPLKIASHDPWAADYQPYALEIFDDDNPAKRDRIQHVLDRADYIIISSNRFYDSLTRIPERWPMTIDYYRALFGGGLGFDLAAEFHSFANLGSWQIDDRSAEEAFSVYDHPRVMIFRKRSQYDPAVVARALGRADLTKVVRSRADRARESPIWLELPKLEARPALGREAHVVSPARLK